jgi:DNA-binding CsgD family transcriptional regulator
LVDSARDLSQPSVVIFISDPQQKRSAPAAVLADLFGFTRAESGLALLLANGLSLDQASNELGVSRNTAKSHLSAIFSKTGLTRQAKLVELILKSVAPLVASETLESS